MNCQEMKNIDLANYPELFYGTISPTRRVPESILKYCADTPRWLVRAQCLSGVQIKFFTDAEILSWECEFGEAAREVYTTDIFIDQQLFTLNGPQKHTLQLAAGRKKVVIHLPHLVMLKNYSLQLNSQATLEALERNQPKLLICGDSILQGMTCSSPSRASVAIAAEALNMELHNTAIGGVIMDDKLVAAALEIDADVVVTGLGVNDTTHGTSLDVFRRRTVESLRRLAEYGKPALVITPIPTTRSELEDQRKVLADIIRKEVQNFPALTLLDGDSFFPQDDELLCDKLHPNDKGMQVYAAALIQTLQKLCKR